MQIKVNCIELFRFDSAKEITVKFLNVKYWHYMFDIMLLIFFVRGKTRISNPACSLIITFTSSNLAKDGNYGTLLLSIFSV